MMFDDSQPIEHIACDELTLHPVVFLFPKLSDAEFEKLLNSICAQGQIDPVWVTSDNQIFDGRHRWMAQKRRGQNVLCRRLKDYCPELLTSIVDRVIAQNLDRRMLSKHQRAMIAISLENKRNIAATKQESGIFDLDGGVQFPWETLEDLVNKFQISKSSFYQAARLNEKAEPEILELINDGAITLDDGAKTISRDFPFSKNDVISVSKDKQPGRAIKNLYAKKREGVQRDKYPEQSEYLEAINKLNAISEIRGYEIDEFRGSVPHHYACMHLSERAIEVAKMMHTHARAEIERHRLLYSSDEAQQELAERATLIRQQFVEPPDCQPAHRVRNDRLVIPTAHLSPHPPD